LKIKSKTWKKYTEDLFDFDAKDINESEFKITQNDYISYIYTESKIYITKLK
jgi:hypothetical protein